MMHYRLSRSKSVVVAVKNGVVIAPPFSLSLLLCMFIVLPFFVYFPSSSLDLSAERSRLLGLTTHGLHPLSNLLVDLFVSCHYIEHPPSSREDLAEDTHLEEFSCTSVDTDGLSLEQVSFVVSVGVIGSNALLVARAD
jgi:hypothetical protein